MQDAIEDSEDKNRLSDALLRYKGDKTKVEQAFNIIEIPSLFGKAGSETTDEKDLLLANRLKDMWSCRLRTIFSDREFSVRTLSADETGDELAVIFYTIREDGK